ncbi:MAG TPA: DUF6152 family protein [Gammaproteobacteria bacterium]
MHSRSLDREARRASVRVAAVAVGLLCAAPSVAHHSFAVHFVEDRLVTVSGVVTEFRFRNPHGIVTLAADDDGGEWRAETNSPNILRRRGWTPDSIKPGDRVTIEGYPARDGSHSMRIYRVIYPDGRELISQRPPAGVAADGED